MVNKTGFPNSWSVKMCSLFLLLFVVTSNVAIVKAEILPLDNVETATASADLKGKLSFVHIIYRHGDRTPIESYATDPWSDVKNWPTGWGQLTNIGKGQHYELGKWLRKRYNSILSQTYDRNEIYVRSTDVDRTLMSALSNLAGLYKPVGKDVWNVNLTWQPIPVHTEPENTDVLVNKKPCPSYERALSALKSSAEFQKLNDRYTYLYNYLTHYSGNTVDSLIKIQGLNNTLFIEALYNKTLPEWTKKVYPSEDMSYISAFSFAIATYTRQLARLKSGPLIKEILQRFVNKSNGSLNPNRSVWIYSAHDTTVANVLNSLKLFEVHSPPYTACVMLELRIYQGLPYVSVFYKNSSEEPKPLFIPQCGIACPLNKMYKLYDDILPSDWEAECKVSSEKWTYAEGDTNVALGILLAVISTIFFVTYTVVIYRRFQTYRSYYSYMQICFYFTSRHKMSKENDA